jgi:hypothetical protein
MSSILLGQRVKQKTNEYQEIPINFSRRFIRSDYLQYTFYVYNAEGNNNPNLTTQMQILRGGKPIAETPEAKISFNEKSPSNMGFSAEIPLQAFPLGRYELQVTVKDKIAKTEIIQKVKFAVK